MKSTTQVTYKKNDVAIAMSIERYTTLLFELNKFKDAMNNVSETFDFSLEDIRNMDSLRYSLLHSLGYESLGKYQHNDYTLPGQMSEKEES